MAMETYFKSVRVVNVAHGICNSYLNISNGSLARNVHTVNFLDYLIGIEQNSEKVRNGRDMYFDNIFFLRV